MAEKCVVKDVIPAEPKDVYEAWLDGKKHAKMTGAGAAGSGKKSAKFTAWDGYISGKNTALIPGNKIVQAWRTTEFPENAPDSKLTVSLKKVKSGTEVTITHTEIPDGQSKSYKKGWIDFYFKPMKKYFNKK
jgi:activator of HSP90 ATPase